jgi:hypothetical protein
MARAAFLADRTAAHLARVAVQAAGQLRSQRVDVGSSEAILGYWFRQHHVGVVCWVDKAASDSGALGLLEQATAEVARQAGLGEDRIYVELAFARSAVARRDGP